MMNKYIIIDMDSGFIMSCVEVIRTRVKPSPMKHCRNKTSLRYGSWRFGASRRIGRAACSTNRFADHC